MTLEAEAEEMAALTGTVSSGPSPATPSIAATSTVAASSTLASTAAAVVTAPVIFEFDDDIQLKLAASAVRDTEFLRRTDGLLDPGHFINAAQAKLVDMVAQYYKKYEKAPAPKILVHLFKEESAKGSIRKEMVADVKALLPLMWKEDISDRDFLVDLVAKFARHQAVEQALIKSVDFKSKGQWDKIEKAMQDALMVGAFDSDEGQDYWEEVDTRTLKREDIKAGLTPPTGITTGIKVLDNLLYHKGWGYEELSVMMGRAKIGKSTALAHFAKNASMAGKNVLYITLEVSSAIISDRFDANIADYPIEKLCADPGLVMKRIKALSGSVGRLRVHEYPPDTLTPAHLKRLLFKYRNKGLIFDLVVIDYLDIMAPDHRRFEEIADSKAVWLGIRKIAKEEHVAILSATQTNREGAKAAVATETDVAEDYNKIRIADLVISINRTDEEERNNECRLYFAASRNQKGKITVKIKQDLEKMNFLKAVLAVE